jgi:hypothetical protein
MKNSVNYCTLPNIPDAFTSSKSLTVLPEWNSASARRNSSPLQGERRQGQQIDPPGLHLILGNRLAFWAFAGMFSTDTLRITAEVLTLVARLAPGALQDDRQQRVGLRCSGAGDRRGLRHRHAL